MAEARLFIAVNHLPTDPRSVGLGRQSRLFIAVNHLPTDARSVGLGRQSRVFVAVNHLPTDTRSVGSPSCVGGEVIDSYRPCVDGVIIDQLRTPDRSDVIVAKRPDVVPRAK